MDSRTGELGQIRGDATPEEVEKFRQKFDIPLTDNEFYKLKPMSRAQRRQWARDNKKRKKREEAEITLKTLDERMQSLERKLDRIFGNAALINGCWVNIK